MKRNYSSARWHWRSRRQPSAPRHMRLPRRKGKRARRSSLPLRCSVRARRAAKSKRCSAASKVGLLFGLRRRHLRLGDEEGGHLLSEEERAHGGRRRGQGDVQGARHDRFLQRARKRRLFGRGEFVRSLSSRQDHLRRRPRRTLHGAGGDRRGHFKPREKFVLPQHGGGRRLSAGAFTAVSDGQINLEPNQTAYNAARDALNGWDPSYGSLYYYNPAIATSSWIFSRPTVTVIGNHVFAK